MTPGQTQLQTTFLRPDALLEHVGVSAGMTVADLGMGAGYFTFAASTLVGTHGKVYAVDVNKSALSNLKSRINLSGQRNVTPIWADLEKPGSTKIPDGTCDIVLLVKVLYQVSKRDRVIAEAARILRPKGQIVVVEWKKAQTSIGPDVKQRIDIKEAEREITMKGFKVAEHPQADEHHDVLVLTKN